MPCPAMGSPAEPSRSRSCKAALIVMQEGAGVRQIVEDDCGSLGGAQLRQDLDVPAEGLGLQESVRSAVQAGYGVVAHLALCGRASRRRLAHRRQGGRGSTRAVKYARPRLRAHADARRRCVRRVRARQALR